MVNNVNKRKGGPKTQVVTTTTTKAATNRGKRSSSRKRKNKFKGKVTTTTVKRVSQPKLNAGRKPRAYKFVNSRAIRASTSGATTAKSRAICLNATLPYEAAPVRIRSGGVGTCYSKPTAVAKHFVTYNMNLADIMGTNEKSTSLYSPVCGYVNGYPIWSDLKQGVPIVSILDHRILAIVPNRATIGDSSLGYRWTYKTDTFVNPGLLQSNSINISYNAADALAPDRKRLIFGRDGVYWLDFTDFNIFTSPPGTTNTPYGATHPGIDYEGKRYVWIDSASTEFMPPANTLAVITFVCTMNNCVPIVDPDDAGETSLKFIVQMLPDDSNNDVQTQTGSVKVTTGVTYSSNIVPKQSGYYCFGLQGYVMMNAISVNDALLETVSIQYNTDQGLNVFSKHVVNPNVVTSNPIEQNFFVSEQTNGGSLLIRNVTPNISAGGTVYAICSQDQNPWFATTAYITTVTTQNTLPCLRYTGPLEKGVYGWLRNENRGFRQSVDTVRYANGTTSSVIRSWCASRKSVTPNSRARGVNVYWLVPPTPSASTTAVPTIINLHYCVQFEYTTLNQTPLVSTSGIEEDELKGAMRLLQTTMTFTENPLHLPGFLNAINGAFGSVKDFYNRNRGGFQTLFKGLSSFGGPISTLGGVATTLDSLM